jgi:prevent-host-death family protein
MIESSSRNLRANLGEYLGRVRYGHERVTVTSFGKPVAAIVSMEDLELLERIEDEMDLKAVEERRDEEAIPWDDAKRELR